MITLPLNPPRPPSTAFLLLSGVILMLAGCATPTSPTISAPPPRQLPGMEMLMGQPPATATHILGAPSLDRQEGFSRQLQFAGACILDLYYYPKPQIGVTATYAEARLPHGDAISAGDCLNLLLKAKPQ